MKSNNTELQPYDRHPRLPLDPDVVQPGVYLWPPHFAFRLQLTVFIGGCLGTISRYGVGLTLPNDERGWPWAIFSVNMLGAFLLGLLLELLVRTGEDRGKLRLIRLGVGTGFLGAFTTYSSFATGLDLLLKNHDVALASLYGVVSILGGMAASAFGIYLATFRRDIRKENNT